MAHTPGPWALRDCPHGGAILKRGVDVREHPQSHLQIVPVEDAQLMAAAPDLLAQLKDAVIWIEEYVAPVALNQKAVERVLAGFNAAIAKAEGGQ